MSNGFVLRLPAIPEDLSPARVAQTAIAEWPPFHEQSRRVVRRGPRGKIQFPVRGAALTTAAITLALVVAGAWTGTHALAAPLNTFRTGVERRATLFLADDFRSHPAAWDATIQSWSRHPEGFVRPADLALYQVAASFTDYRLEFLAQIEHKGVSCVIRARDRQNYHALRFVITHPGPRPQVAIVRYSVLDGHRSGETQSALPLAMFHNDEPFRVDVTVRGNRFVASVDGQVVDEWTDDRIPSGGVGFYRETGELARLYWMRLARNTDLLGKICALMSGQNPSAPSSAGSLTADVDRTRRWLERTFGSAR